MTVAIIGAGKVGRMLALALRRAGQPVSLRPARRGLPARRLRSALLVLAVRDGALRTWAGRLSTAGVVSSETVVLHVSGVHDAAVLRALRGRCAGVGQAHPLVSFAGPKVDLRGASLVIDGDPAALRAAVRLARAVGMIPRRWSNVDRVAYHAAACLVANGSVALCAAGARILELAGAPPCDIVPALSPLLASVAGNLATAGLPGALTGPIRRGDADTIVRHLEWLEEHATPQLSDLYRSIAEAQIGLATALGEAKPRDTRNISRLLRQKPDR